MELIHFPESVQTVFSDIFRVPVSLEIMRTAH